MLYWSEFEIGDPSLNFESRCINHLIYYFKKLAIKIQNQITYIIKIKN